ncbi:MAG: alkaline phosphatase family protein [Polyangiaceae bacterium]|nr:alkaline phosphatase family protein [Polyangiaceae bacterium]
MRGSSFTIDDSLRARHTQTMRRWISLLPTLSMLACTQTAPTSSSRAEPKNAPDPPASIPEGKKPRLILWLTIDQLRGGYLDKYRRHFGQDGFQRIARQGMEYSHAHYGHAITETAPGHATLFTGAAPREHGIIGNSWLTPKGKLVTSVLDPKTNLVGPGELKMGPTTPPTPGRSPHRLLVPTLGDQMKKISNGQALVYGVSTKDRGAILPAGHAGQAFWLGEKGFVTSTYYSVTTPPWLEEHHREHPPENYLSAPWSLSLAEELYLNPPSSSPFRAKLLGQNFPHHFSPHISLSQQLALSPAGDEAVIDLSISLLRSEALGLDLEPDLLSISLSSTDKIGHAYGPESREFEDQLIKLDRLLARLFSAVDKQVSRDELIIILSADHGGCETVSHLRSLNLPALRLTEETVAHHVREILRDEFNDDSYLLGISSPYVYLDQERIRKKQINESLVREKIAQGLLTLQGVHSTYTQYDTQGGGALQQRVNAAFHRERSGAIYIVPRPYTLFLQNSSLAATHGSPWYYDTHVPLFIVAPGVAPGISHEQVDIRSIVPTIAQLIQIPAPAAASWPALRALE